MTFVFPPFQLSIYMGYLVGGYLVDMCVCVSTVSTSLLKSRYDMIGMLQLMSGKKIKVARLDTPQLVQIFRSGADQL